MILFHFDWYNEIELFSLVTSDIAVTKHIQSEVVLAGVWSVEGKGDFSLLSYFESFDYMQFILFIVADQHPPILLNRL